MTPPPQSFEFLADMEAGDTPPTHGDTPINVADLPVKLDAKRKVCSMSDPLPAFSI